MTAPSLAQSLFKMTLYLNQDLNVYYLSGSGNHIFLQYLLLGDHYCEFHDQTWKFAWIQQALKRPWFLEYVMQRIKLNRADYQAVNPGTWPTYTNYLDLSEPIEDPRYHEALIASLSNKSVIDQITHDHWRVMIRDCLDILVSGPSLSVDNQLTMESTTPRGCYKVFVTCVTTRTYKDFDQWPGARLCLWTDHSSRLRMLWYFRQGVFGSKHECTICRDAYPQDKILPYKKALPRCYREDIEFLKNLSNQQLRLQDILEFPHDDRLTTLLKIIIGQHPYALRQKIGLIKDLC